MALLQQIVDMLSRPPGSIVFHLVTLFALQAVLALAYVRWRRDPDDEAARRMAIAAGGILVARLLLVVASLFIAADPGRTRLILPPLEQAVNTATAILLVWGLVELPGDRPRLADAVLLVSLVVVAIMGLFFYQDWQNRAGDSLVGYFETTQATVWATLQLLILGAGTLWLAIDSRSRLTLRPFIVGSVLVASGLQMWQIQQAILPTAEPVLWARLGYLVAFPLWAVLVYREDASALTYAGETGQVSAGKQNQSLVLAAQVLEARIPQLRLELALDMVMALLPARFAAIGLIDENDPQRVVFNHRRPSPIDGADPGWQMNMTNRSALRLAFEQQRGVELLPRGVGARQVHDLSQQFNVGPLGPVFVQPLRPGEHFLGFLIVAAPASLSNWSDQDRALIPSLATFLAQALENSRVRDEYAVDAAAEQATLDELDRTQADLSAVRKQLDAAVVAGYGAHAVLESTLTRPEDASTTLVVPSIQLAVRQVLPLMREKKLRLDLALAEEIPAVAVREDVLQQLITSLLDNACQAAAEESPVKLRVAANGHNENGVGTLHIAITDHGSGIPPEDTGRVFDTQAYREPTEPIPGLGDGRINFALVRRLALATGGDLSLTSTPGVGSTFDLMLPAVDNSLHKGSSDESVLPVIPMGGIDA